MDSAYDDNGWPLGLQPLHVRARQMENHILTEPNAFNALIAVSPSFSSESSSSDLDTESTGSFFYERSITLGNLIGIQSELGGQEEIPSAEIPSRRNKRRSKTWWNFCGNSDDCHENSLPPSLGQFLEVERRAAASNRREKMYFNVMYDDYSAEQSALDANPLFADGQILPPQLPSEPSWVPLSSSLPQPTQGFFTDQANSRGGSVERSHHHRSYSLGSKVPTLFLGICGRTSIEA